MVRHLVLLASKSCACTRKMRCAEKYKTDSFKTSDKSMARNEVKDARVLLLLGLRGPNSTESPTSLRPLPPPSHEDNRLFPPHGSATN